MLSHEATVKLQVGLQDTHAGQTTHKNTLLSVLGARAHAVLTSCTCSAQTGVRLLGLTLAARDTTRVYSQTNNEPSDFHVITEVR